MIEPIQGEGGVRVVPRAFLRGLREICDRRGLLLIFDEVQTGIGRTGRLFAYEHCGIHPDILTSAKGIGERLSDLRLSATADAARGLTVGIHGTTFGGNTLAMAIGNATLDVILAPGLYRRVARTRSRHASTARRAQGSSPLGDRGIRGEGLMIGLKLKVPPANFAEAALNERLLVIPAGDNVVRLLPPLIVSDEELAEGTRRLEASCAAVEERLLVATN